MRFWNVILATIVIFGAGVITGGLLVNHVEHPPVVHRGGPGMRPPPPDGLPMPMRADILNKQLVQLLNEKLDLTSQQSNRIQKIISDGQQRTHELWKLVAPQIQLVLRDTRQQIRQVLTPDQRKQFEILMRQQHHPQSTNAPAVPLSAHTNTPAPMPATTNGPVI